MAEYYTDSNGKQVRKESDGRIYDCNTGEQIARQEGDRIYNTSGDQIARREGNQWYNRNNDHFLTERSDGRIYGTDGNQKYRKDSIKLMVDKETNEMMNSLRARRNKGINLEF